MKAASGSELWGNDARAVTFGMFDVSRETQDRIDFLVAELARWQAVQNLVGPATMGHVWQRHIADSLQLLDLAEPNGTWVDLGSGGGFPGLIAAIVRTERQQGQTHLIESKGKKCAFLRHIIRSVSADAVVHEGRIEMVLPSINHPVGVVSARALAPLPILIGWSSELLRKGALGIFPKGQHVDSELLEAHRIDGVSTETLPSKVDHDGCIVLVRMSPSQDVSNA